MTIHANSLDRTSENLIRSANYPALVELLKDNYLKCPSECYDIIDSLPLESDVIDPLSKANFLNLKGIVLFNKSKYFEATAYFKASMAVAKEHSFDEMLTKLLINFSSICIRFNRNKEAIRYAYDSLKFHYPRYNAMAYQNLGTLYNRLGEKEKELECKLKSLEINKKIGEKVYICIDLTNLGIYHQENGDLESARKLFEENLAHCIKYNLNVSKVGAIADLVKVYTKLKEYDLAIKTANASLAEAKELENNRELLEIQSYLVESYYEIGDIENSKKSIQEFNKIKNIPDGFEEKKHVFQYSMKIAEDEGDYKHALKISKDLNEFLIQLREESLDADLDDYVSLREREIDEIRSRNTTIEQRNREITSISNLMAHDLKTPIRNINSFAELLTKKIDVLSPDAKDCLDFITNSSKELYQKLDLIEFYLNYNLKKPLIEVDLNRLLSNIQADLNSFKGKLEFKKNLPSIRSNSDALYKLFSILVSLAINNSTKRDPVVTIQIEVQEKDFFIKLSDDKDGYKNSELSFKDFFKLVDKNEGLFEIGVAFCRRIVFLHNGKLLFNPSENNQASLEIWIPKKGL